MSQDSTHTIFQSAKRFFSGTMLSRISGMLRDMSMAYAFGTQEAIAAFMVAFRFSHLLRRLFGEGALQTAFIPRFEELRHEDSSRAFEFFKDLLMILSAGLTLLIIIAMTILGGCLYFFTFSPDNQEILFLTLLMMPSLLFICLFGVNAALLQCEKKYFLTGVAPVAFNLIWIACVLFLRDVPTQQAMPWLASGVIIACLCQWLITVPKVWAALKQYAPNRKILWNAWTQDIKTFSTPLFLGIIGVAASQINNAVDAIFARYADLEGPAMLWYALRIQQLPLALFGIAIAGALLPPLSRALKRGDREQYRHFLSFAIQRSIMLMLPITVALLLFGDSIINLIYGHGDFNDHSVVETTLCLWGYGIGLVPMTLVLILAPAFYAQGNYKIPTRAATLSVVMNMTLNGVLIGFFGYGAFSVAIATSASSLFNCGMLAWYLRHDLQTAMKRADVLHMGKVCIAVSIGTLALLAYGSNALALLSGAPIAFPHGFFAQIVHMGAQVLIFTGAIVIVAYQIRSKEQIALMQVLNK